MADTHCFKLRVDAQKIEWLAVGPLKVEMPPQPIVGLSEFFSPKLWLIDNNP